MIQISENMTDQERIDKARELVCELEFLTRSQKYYGVDDSILEYEKQLDTERLDEARFTDDEITNLARAYVWNLGEKDPLLFKKCKAWIFEIMRFRQAERLRQKED
jgi:hypothetical protein